MADLMAEIHENAFGTLRRSDMTLRDYFAGQAGEPPKEFVDAYKAAHPMGRIRYTYGNSDEDRSSRKHDLRIISEYHASIRSAWATSFADAMLAARNNTNNKTENK